MVAKGAYRHRSLAFFFRSYFNRCSSICTANGLPGEACHTQPVRKTYQSQATADCVSRYRHEVEPLRRRRLPRLAPHL